MGQAKKRKSSTGRIKQTSLKLDQEYLEELHELALGDRRTVAWEIREAIGMYVRARNKELFSGPSVAYVGSSLKPEQREELNKEQDNQTRIDMIKRFINANTGIDIYDVPEVSATPSPVAESAALGDNSHKDAQQPTSDPKGQSESES